MSRAGKYVNRGNYKYFLPKPLPPDPPVQIDKELLKIFGEANHQLGNLNGIIQTIPNPLHFITMYIRKEALLSSQIEGTQASLVDVLSFEKEEKKIRDRNVREVINYIKALEYGLKRINEIPFSLRLLKEIHGVLMKGTRGENRNSGEFRDNQNWIGPPGTDIADAEFVPPPVEEMKKALAEFEDYYHYGNEEPIIKCGLLHAQFETIHPFLDGNGRIGRLLITFFLMEREILQEPILYLSSYLKQNRQDYYKSLMRIRDSGDWEGWLRFFLKGVVDVARQGILTANSILDLQKRDREKIKENSKSKNSLLLFDLLLENPIIIVEDIIEKLGISRGTAYKLVKEFMEIGILVEITGKERYRKFLYNEYFKIVSKGTED